MFKSRKVSIGTSIEEMEPVVFEKDAWVPGKTDCLHFLAVFGYKVMQGTEPKCNYWRAF